MASYTPKQGARILHKLADLLTDRSEQSKLRRDYAFQVRAGAERIAAGRPTPQARMAASGLRVKGGSVLGFPGTRISSFGRSVRLGGVSFGAEYGSNTHSQFGPRREGGYFLNPAAERVNDEVGNKWLGDVLDAAFTRFG